VCGPCSEIFYKTDDGGEVEIWNLVFTQFNRVGSPPDNLRPLPSKNIDTGMGLERTAAMLQNASSNFHIDILLPLVERAADVCGLKYDRAGENGRRMRRIADHVRACTFAIHENVYPGPNKEKYVVKRLLRRAVLDGRQVGVHEPFLHKLVPLVAELMRHPYPELGETTTRVAQVIEKEESNFFSTIDAGLDRIERLFAHMKSQGRETVSGAEAAEMYTTHGFPPELFETLAAEHNLGFDWTGFNREMEQHGIDSGAGQRMELFQSSPLDALKKTLGGTPFVGYETTTCEARIVGIIARGELVEQVDEVGHEQPICLVLDNTPFYGESGGQVGDTGWIVAGGLRFQVTDSQKEGNFTLHLGHLREGRVEQGTKVRAEVDADRRQGIRRAHSATHILHHALQKHLGKHAQQQGSKVDFDWLRFDFTNPAAVGPEELAAIEADVNRLAATSARISWRSLPLAQARETGATMLFGEKYPDIVRMVAIGEFSKELCGGTHLDNSGQVGLFKIVGEESVAAGTRRITALTGTQALAHVRNQEAALAETAALLRVPPAEVPQRVAALAKELRELKKQMASAPRAGGVTAEGLLAEAGEVGGAKVVVAEAPGADAGAMRQLIDQLRKTASPVAVLLGSRAEGKVTLVAGISRDLEARGLNAGGWIRGAAEVVGGRGGGKPDMAQAGGKHPEKLGEALAAARKDIDLLLNK
jgi:alanyl-tRNA synthetase